MKVLIDACALFPTVLREIVIGAAGQGAFTPVWSARILEEWRHAAGKKSPQDQAIAEVEIATLRHAFPDAEVPESRETQLRLSLPDLDDIHVLAAAIDGGAGELLTLNVKDFPTRTLAREAVLLRQPDEFLLEIFHNDPKVMQEIVGNVLQKAAHHGIKVSNPRAVLKRARLPRLGKALYAS